MIKLKLSIDPTQPKQVEALNVLLLIIGQPKVYPATMSFADPVVRGEDLNIFARKQAEAEEAQNRFVHDMVETQKEAEKPKRTRAAKPAPAEEPKEEVVNEQQQMQKEIDADKDFAEEAKKSEPTVTIEQVREVLGKKVGDHRETIKAKLTELGAKNVSVLDASHYDNFHAFLTNL